eukprot:2159673-Pyramimonas_sp.AAC.1
MTMRATWRPMRPKPLMPTPTACLATLAEERRRLAAAPTTPAATSEHAAAVLKPELAPLSTRGSEREARRAGEGRWAGAAGTPTKQDT